MCTVLFHWIYSLENKGCLVADMSTAYYGCAVIFLYLGLKFNKKTTLTVEFGQNPIS
jgi:hypothetical protein